MEPLTDDTRETILSAAKSPAIGVGDSKPKSSITLWRLDPPRRDHLSAGDEPPPRRWIESRFIETQLLEYLKLLDERLKGTIAELD